MVTDTFHLDHFTIRRKVFKLFGASFHVYEPAGRVVGFSKQKAFNLKEDIRLYTDESASEELLAIRARQIIDFRAAYDILDASTGTLVGAARRKGFTSLLRDSWELLDEDGQLLAKVQEDSQFKALLRRFLSNLIPQTFHLKGDDGVLHATLRQRFNPFVYKLDVTIEQGSPLDRRLVFAAAILLAAIEGRQG